MAVIEIVAYDPSWPERFAAEAARLCDALGELALRVDHVGSTAVPGLAAKPVIDVQVTVSTLAPLEPWVERFTQLGYTHMPSPDDARYPFFHRPARWPHSHHVHLCLPRSWDERSNLALRDYLREHPEACDSYVSEKRRLAALHLGATALQREGYAAAKSPFLEPLTARALALGYPHERSATVPEPRK